MAKAHANSWEVTDEFWSRVEPLVPQAPEQESQSVVVGTHAGPI